MDIPSADAARRRRARLSRFRAFGVHPRQVRHERRARAIVSEDARARVPLRACRARCSTPMRRLKLIWSCLNDDRKGGANIPIEKHVAKGKHGGVKETLLAGDARPQRAEVPVRRLGARALGHAAAAHAPGGLQGNTPREKQGLLMAFAYITQGYGLMAVFGIVVMLWWCGHPREEVRERPPGEVRDYRPWFYCYICSGGSFMVDLQHGNLEAHGADLCIEVEHGRLRRKRTTKAPVPRFARHVRPGLRPGGAFYPPYKRRRRIFCGVWVTCLCIAGQSPILAVMRLDEDRGRHGIMPG